MSPKAEDPITFGKFFKGILGRNILKLFSFALTIICLSLFVWGGVEAFKVFSPKKAASTASSVAPSSVTGDVKLDSKGGAIATSETQNSVASTTSETRSVTYNITNMPFSLPAGLVGIMGSLFKTQGDETRMVKEKAPTSETPTRNIR